MATPYIVVGCPTTGGGQVLSGNSMFQIEGIPIACVGDKATCPKHKTVATIISGDPNMQIFGKAAARVNDSLSCGCKLLPKQSLVVQDNGGGSSSTDSSSTTNTLMSQLANIFEDKFKLVSQSGEPLKNINYLITRAYGTTETGKTDNFGFTHLVNTNDQAEILSIQATYDY
ncbi:PAAR domain-containing protein [Acinetobacter courvalinii]|uniref:PAAR domain-containing protein n=1 Tax=Acinetobacter courvalinii TaxID=280147 RepID=UPI0028982256|nr:PAAR domain-containing protein [Acinetobacter courvalinii]